MKIIERKSLMLAIEYLFIQLKNKILNLVDSKSIYHILNIFIKCVSVEKMTSAPGILNLS